VGCSTGAKREEWLTGTSWERRPAAVVIALELAGALLILARSILGQLRLLISVVRRGGQEDARRSAQG
jgi:hypothetical protein